MFGKTECSLNHATRNWPEVYQSETISVRRFTPAKKTCYEAAEVTSKCIIVLNGDQWKI